MGLPKTIKWAMAVTLFSPIIKLQTFFDKLNSKYRMLTKVVLKDFLLNMIYYYFVNNLYQSFVK